MNAPAVPKYVRDAATGLSGIPPGHRFNLYFPIWRDDWQLDKTGKAAALRECLKFGDAAAPLKALLVRQQAMAEALPEDRRHIVEGRATSPFATGLGLEHPVENGFAFLSPYGLPYLAGSGVKGVLRRAAEELEKDGHLPGGTAFSLFGHEDANDARRGALTCWDVFPVPPKDELAVEILTPHFGDYYQNKGTPHDAGKPNPIPFLAVPAGSAFRFVITCEPALLPPAIGDWKAVIHKIIQHAFDWLGFGAKTAVGYGALEEDPAAAEARQRNEDAARQRTMQVAEAARLASLSPEAQEMETARACMATFRNAFESEKAKGKYKAGSPIDEKRLNFFRLALEWKTAAARAEAAALLREVIKWSDWPGNKERKQQFKDWLATLDSGTT
jgi:CRISPR-associated protein Cmr6